MKLTAKVCSTCGEPPGTRHPGLHDGISYWVDIEVVPRRRWLDRLRRTASSLDRRAKSRGSDRRDALRRLLDRLGLRRTARHVARHPEQDGPK